MKLYFLNTCMASPEQYEVYTEAGEEVAYVRYRWGQLYAEFPTVGGEVIYEKDYEDNLGGRLDEEERPIQLQNIADSIMRKYRGLDENVNVERTDWVIVNDPSELPNE